MILRKISELERLIWPLMVNAKQVKDGIGVYEAIARNAKAINKTQHKFYFALSQRNALQLAVLGIAKIYDSTSKSFKKHTVYELEKYFLAHWKKVQLRWLSQDMIKFLGIAEQEALALMSSDEEIRFGKFKELQDKLTNTIPRYEKDEALTKIINYRHKFVSHQELLNNVLQKTYSELPEFDEFKRLALFSEEYAGFIGSTFTRTAFLPSGTPSAKTATLNVIKKVLDLDFDIHTPAGYDAYKEFYGIKKSH